MFWISQRRRVEPIFLNPGDTFVLLVDDTEVLSTPIGKTQTVNEIGVAEFKNEFGLDSGVVGFFGEQKNE